MYPYLRSIGVLLAARRLPRLSPEDTSVISTVCWPWDADMFLELHNGRHLTLFDLGRFGHGARLGLVGVLRERRWGLVVGGAFVQYRRRIRLFQRFDIVSRCLGRDEKWFYFEQITRRGGAACSGALLRVSVVAGPKGTVPTQDVCEALGIPEWRGSLPGWAVRMVNADSARPWPPDGLVGEAR